MKPPLSVRAHSLAHIADVVIKPTRKARACHSCITQVRRYLVIFGKTPEVRRLIAKTLAEREITAYLHLTFAIHGEKDTKFTVTQLWTPI